MTKKSKRVSYLVTELNAAADRMTPERRAYLSAFASRQFPPDVVQLIDELTPMPAGATPFLCELVENLRSAIKVGFVLALARYGRELKSNAEAMQIIGARVIGGDKGRMTQANRKQKRRSRVQAMLGQGMDVPAIARELKCSIATVYRALNQPTKNPSRRSQKR